MKFVILNQSLDLVDLCKNVQKTVVTNPIVDQLLRSGTSVGANYCEANGASSKRDFKNKIFICKKEAKEAKYWLRLLKRIDSRLGDECGRLMQEAQELLLIFSKIAKSSE